VRYQHHPRHGYHTDIPRFVKDPPPPFQTQTEASNAFAARARQLLQADIETPSISRVQALLMLTGHDWGAGNGRRAWIYLGMAIRHIEVMELTRELDTPKGRKPTREEFIEAEVRRRTAWTCFLMDSLLSGGKGRKRSLAAGDMAIQLPCERENFVFGEPERTERLDGKVRVGELGIIAYSMRAANIWGKVARWACSEELKVELPWLPTSQFHQLIIELQEWKKNLPPRLQYDLFSLHSHNAVDQGQAYCYMHSIYFMSNMFLHRAYLPVLGPQSTSEEAPQSYNEHQEFWKSWQKQSRRELFNEASTVLEMLDEMRTFGVYFLRGLVPWIGFTIYTAVGVMLYSFNFPRGEDDPRIATNARGRVIAGCEFLRDMKTQWPMAETWFETIKRMQAYYRSVMGQASPVSPDERQALRHAMVDYGALQPSPVQKPADAKMRAGIDVRITTHEVCLAHCRSYNRLHKRQVHAKTETTSTTTSTTLITPTASTPSGFTSNFNWNAHQSIPPLEEDDSFLSFDLSNEELEEFMDATHEFWASFPGEVGVAM
jgi:hypothetical protein